MDVTNILYFVHGWQNTKIFGHNNEVSSCFMIFCNGKYKTLNLETTSFKKVNSHKVNYTFANRLLYY